MSHFAVLVIGDDIEQQLQPYHEFECTGHMDEYVEWVPAEKTEKDWRGHNAHEAVKELKPDQKRYVYDTFAEYMTNWVGARQNEDGEWGGWTNPNHKWDWWVVGGLWRNSLKLKVDAEPYAKIDDGDGDGYSKILHGEKDLEGWCTSARLCDIDLEGMRQAAAQNAEMNHQLWLTRLEKGENDQRHTWGLAKEQVEALKKKTPREVGHAAGKEHPLLFFAVVKDSVWYEKGRIIMFGISTDEKEDAAWEAEVKRLLEDVPPETPITVVDCHT